MSSIGLTPYNGIVRTDDVIKTRYIKQQWKVYIYDIVLEGVYTSDELVDVVRGIFVITAVTIAATVNWRIGDAKTSA